MSNFLFNEVNRIELTEAHKNFLTAYDIFMEANYTEQTPEPIRKSENEPLIEPKRRLELIDEKELIKQNKNHNNQFEEFKKDQLGKGSFIEPSLNREHLSKLLSFGCQFPNKTDYKTKKEQTIFFYNLKLEIEENVLPAIDAAVNEKQLKYVLETEEFKELLKDHPELEANIIKNQLERVIETDEFKYWLNEHPEIKATVIEKHMKCVDEENSLMKWLEEYLDPRYFEDVKPKYFIKDITTESEAGGRLSFKEQIALEILDFIKNKKGLGKIQRCIHCNTYILWQYKNTKYCSIKCRAKKWFDANKKKGRIRNA